MYAETELMMFPYFQNFCQDAQPLEQQFSCSQKYDASMGNNVEASTIWEYELGLEEDLFKAPLPVIEELSMAFDDSMKSAISMASCGEEDAMSAISTGTLKLADIESIQTELLNGVLYECEKDLLEKEATVKPISAVLENKIAVTEKEETQIAEEKLFPFERSPSSGCFHGGEFGAVCEMRRAFSEGDLKNLGSNGRVRPPINIISEDRRQKLTRYWNKKSKRNFGRKIKYACRKVLADSQPRVRGRFAKTDESDSSKN